MTVLPAALSTLVGGLSLAALSRKWSLRTHDAVALIVLATSGSAVAGLAAAGAWPGLRRKALPLLLPAGQLALYMGGMLARFYRDPERHPPADPHAIVSPADGTVIYLRKLPPGAILRTEKKGAVMGLDELDGVGLRNRELWQIGISMVFTDVHVNRAPMAGRVTLVHHRPGLFLSLRRQEAASVNERRTMVIEEGERQLALVQVASRLVRRIQGFVEPGDWVERGQRIGMIKFGSQVDLFIPAAHFGAPAVTVGQHLTAGETVICRRC